MKDFECDDNNHVDFQDGVVVRGRVKGKNNHICIEKTALPCVIVLDVHGDGNRVEIGPNSRCKQLSLRVGNHIPAHKCKVTIGAEFSSEPGCKFYIFNSGNSLEIGENCMFSRDIIVRTGESPHLLFDRETGQYIDTDGAVSFGDNVWVGEYSYITKKASLNNNTIVAAKSVVTRKFDQEYCAIGGNPAQIIRQNIEWVRNRGFLEKGSVQHESYHAHQRKFLDE